MESLIPNTINLRPTDRSKISHLWVDINKNYQQILSILDQLVEGDASLTFVEDTYDQMEIFEKYVMILFRDQGYYIIEDIEYNGRIVYIVSRHDNL